MRRIARIAVLTILVGAAALSTTTAAQALPRDCTAWMSSWIENDADADYAMFMMNQEVPGSWAFEVYFDAWEAASSEANRLARQMDRAGC